MNDCVATAPTSASAQDASAPIARNRDCTATPHSRRSRSHATMEYVELVAIRAGQCKRSGATLASDAACAGVRAGQATVRRGKPGASTTRTLKELQGAGQYQRAEDHTQTAGPAAARPPRRC